MKIMVGGVAAVALCAAMPGGVAVAQPAVPAPALAAIVARTSPIPGTILVDRDTMVRLMVVNEVSTKVARAGDRFVLRVDEDVVIGGVKVVPVGTKAWGEVLRAEESGAVGKAGRLSARLLYVDLPDARLPIRGDQVDKGPGGAGSTVLAVVGLGVLGLFTRGTNAKLKAGDIFNGYVAEDMIFDPATRHFVSAPIPAIVVGAAPPAAALVPVAASQ
jgi:hypothetical protein